MRNKNELLFQKKIHEINEVIEDSAASVGRAVRMARNTREIGADTVEALEGQSKQIQKIEEITENIQNKAEQAEESILNIKTYGLSRFFPPIPDFLKHPFSRKSKDEPPRHSTLTQSIKQELPRHHEPKLKQQYNEPVDRTLLDEKHLELLGKTNEGLDELGEIIDDLNQLAREQGKEITWQNKHLDKLKPKIEMAKETVNYETRRAGML
ncbi:hypothetical protein OQJ05_06125 [Fluoribacter gormanii]|uniref:hypothetical protein n=1 Tax=Fluoribacter gormanii TaxID=464 RepID=UPI0022449819|nr:hypothetical protein [Fluoribacter gormanii]MCW8443624.1 hypothetical protein [Fluoribacter gormanii]